MKPMTIESLAAMPLSERTSMFYDWLGEQPFFRSYDYSSRRGCALAQFARHLFPGSSLILGGTTGVIVYDNDDWRSVDVEIIPKSASFALAAAPTFGILRLLLRRHVTRPFWRPLSLRIIARVLKADKPLAA